MSLKRAVIVPNEKFLFTQFRILLTFLIPNENSNTQLNENELGHEKTCLMSYANNKGADQHMYRKPVSNIGFSENISLKMAEIRIETNICVDC